MSESSEIRQESYWSSPKGARILSAKSITRQQKSNTLQRRLDATHFLQERRRDRLSKSTLYTSSFRQEGIIWIMLEKRRIAKDLKIGRRRRGRRPCHCSKAAERRRSIERTVPGYSSECSLLSLLLAYILAYSRTTRASCSARAELTFILDFDFSRPTFVAASRYFQWRREERQAAISLLRRRSRGRTLPSCARDHRSMITNRIGVQFSLVIDHDDHAVIALTWFRICTRLSRILRNNSVIHVCRDLAKVGEVKVIWVGIGLHLFSCPFAKGWLIALRSAPVSTIPCNFN